MREFESSHSSQPVRRSEKMSLILAERPANGVLSRTGGQSVDSEFVQFRSKIADSLRQIFEKLPFFGRLRLDVLRLNGIDDIGDGEIEFSQYAEVEALRDGRRVEIRALRPEDRNDLIAAVRRIGSDSLYRRFFIQSQWVQWLGRKTGSLSSAAALAPGRIA